MRSTKEPTRMPTRINFSLSESRRADPLPLQQWQSGNNFPAPLNSALLQPRHGRLGQGKNVEGNLGGKRRETHGHPFPRNQLPTGSRPEVSEGRSLNYKSSLEFWLDVLLTKMTLFYDLKGLHSRTLKPKSEQKSYDSILYLNLHLKELGPLNVSGQWEGKTVTS